MDSTDTRTQLETLERGLERDRPRNSTRWVAAAAAAAAVVVAALVVVNVRGDDRTDTPADSVDTQVTTDVASGFMAAVAAYDADRAASYLADDASIQLRTSTVDAESTGRQLRWNRAVEFRLIPRGCELESVSPPAATVACAYDTHGLGSDRLGRGPFTGNVLRLTMVDDEIVTGVEELGSDEFEVTMWEPFVAWLVSNRADEAAFMFADSPWAMRPALSEHSARLWATNVDRYVRAVERGEAP
ncbi:MAG TPA: hypothetical protein VFQ17_00145 [Nocardioides sp.]|nr:hypothetical protein [Nocardioides sp.]